MASFYSIDPSSLEAAPYELMRCPQCTLVYQRFAGDDHLLGELYGEWLSDPLVPEDDAQYRADVAAPLRSRDGHEILVAAQYLDRTPERMTVLDFGMGWGLWARVARELGCAVYGHELAKDRVAYAKNHAIESIGAADLGRPLFHFINTEQVMEHVRDLAPTAALLARSLRPGGILKISVPNGARAMAIVARLRGGHCAGTVDELMPVQPLEHVNSFTPRALSFLAGSLGLRIVRPSLLQGYAFLRTPGTIGWSDPAKTIKELVRPLFQRLDSRNLYVWMQKPA